MLEMRFIYLDNGEKMAYRLAGSYDKPKILLIHGHLSSSFFFEAFMHQLKDHYCLLAIDMRGFGESSYHHPFDSMAELAGDILQVLKCLSFEDCYLVSWSSGGGVALELAAKLSSIKGSILLSFTGFKGFNFMKQSGISGAYWPQYQAHPKEMLAEMLEAPLLRAYRDKNPAIPMALYRDWIFTQNEPEAPLFNQYIEECLKQRNLLDYELAMRHFNVTHEFNGFTQGSGHIDAIESPILVVQGLQDKLINLADWQGVELPENMQLLFLPECGHAPHHDQPLEIAALIERFTQLA